MRKWIILGVALILALLADQASKGWATANLELYESAVPVPALAPLFQFTRSSNTGAAFGIFPMAGDVFLLLALLIIAALLWYAHRSPADARLIPLAIGMVIGGASGNILDRLQYGHVVDFIHYQIPNLISNVSNLADHAIVLGALLLVLENAWRERRAKRNEPAASETVEARG